MNIDNFEDRIIMHPVILNGEKVGFTACYDNESVNELLDYARGLELKLKFLMDSI
jgi:hypothetical protein